MRGGVVVTVASTGTASLSTTGAAGVELMSNSSAAAMTLRPAPLCVSLPAIAVSRMERRRSAE